MLLILNLAVMHFSICFPLGPDLGNNGLSGRGIFPTKNPGEATANEPLEDKTFFSHFLLKEIQEFSREDGKTAI